MGTSKGLVEINLFNFVRTLEIELLFEQIDSNDYYYRLEVYTDCLVENLLLTSKEIATIIESAQKVR